jgi:hypothetical protein
MQSFKFGIICFALALAPAPAMVRAQAAAAAEYPDAIVPSLERAAANRPQIEAAYHGVTGAEQEGMTFLIQHMSTPDLQTLSAEFLLENVREAYVAKRAAPWAASLPDDIFLNNVLPYANVNETRDRWRKDFRERFSPLVADAKTPAEAAALLNNKIYSVLNVRYSTKRRRADQGPYESIESGLASCTGLTVLLVDACRAVGVPARFAGTPLWTNLSGNHSWVEVWDAGWHFTGAAEPTGNVLDKGWFTGRAGDAKVEHPQHAIYAVSYKRTPINFPMVWATGNKNVFAVNVTDRYTTLKEVVPEGYIQALFKVYQQNGERCAANVSLLKSGEEIFRGKSKDERFDANDHLRAKLRQGEEYDVEIELDGVKIRKRIEIGNTERVYSYKLEE